MKLFLPYFLAAVLGPVDARNLKNAFRLAPVVESDASPRVKMRPSRGSERLSSTESSPSLGSTQKNKKGSSKGSPKGSRDSSGVSLVFSMTNEPTNELLVYTRDVDDGTLTFREAVPTGASGGHLTTISGTSAGGPLGSQDGIVVGGTCVFAVNAGSSSVSSFQISGSSGDVTLAGVYPTNGPLPTSIAVRDDLVYVLNSAEQGSFQGFQLNENGCTLRAIGDTIELDQGGPVSPFNPPSGPGSPGEIGFTPEGDILVSIKINGGFDNVGNPGSLNHYKISDDGTTSAAALTQTLIDDRPGSSVPFAFDFDDEGTLIVMELDPLVTGMGGPGGLSYWEEDDGVYTQVGDIAINGQTCGCWVKYNPLNGCSYTTNACNAPTGNSISSVSADFQVTEVAASTQRPLDVVITPDGEYLYVYSPNFDFNTAEGDPHIIVYKAAENECTLTHVQTITDGFDPAFIVGNGPQAIAAYPAREVQ